VATILKIF